MYFEFEEKNYVELKQYFELKKRFVFLLNVECKNTPEHIPSYIISKEKKIDGQFYTYFNYLIFGLAK